MFFLGNLGQENVFYDILERKNAFVGYKNKKFKRLKNWHFSKGNGFAPKIAIFPSFFLGNIGQENVNYDVVQREKAFLGYKKKKLEKSKNWHFSKGHGFAPKIAIFPTFFLGNIGQENVNYDVVERENAFLGYKNKQFKNSKNWHISKGANPWFCSKNSHFSNFFF